MSSCPPATFSSPRAECLPCHHSCSQCSGPASQQCSGCRPGLFLARETSQCVARCPPATRAQAGLCVDCPRHCLTCEAGGCRACEAGTVMSAGGECVVRCGPGFFLHNSTHCSACHPSCQSCVGPGDTDCARCGAASLYFSRRCVPYCPAGYTPDSGGAECLSCPRGCDECRQPGHCQDCQAGWTLAQDGLCQPPPPQLCQPGLYRGGGTCLACHQTCRTCDGPGQEDCTGCYSDHKQFRSTCSADCPPGETSQSYLLSLISTPVVRLLHISPGKLLYQLPPLLPDL